MLRLSSALLRAVGLFFLAVYFVAAILFLGMRYWVLPNIDQWRPYIAQQLSHALGSEVTLGSIQAEWNALNPRLDLHGVVFTDARHRKVLRLPQVEAIISWRSLLTLTPQFVSLEARGIELSVRRDRAQRLWVVGQSFETEAPAQLETGSDLGALQWLATQPRIVLRDASLRWIDESRAAPALVLRHATLNIHNDGADHRFALQAMTPIALGQALDIRGEFRRAEGASADQAFALESGTGKVYVRVEKMRPLGWAPWVDMPQNLEAGEVSAQAVLTLAQGQVTHLTSDVSVAQGRWNFGDDTRLQADSARLYLDGPWAGFQRIFSSQPVSSSAVSTTQAATTATTTTATATTAATTAATATATVNYDLQSSGLQLNAASIFEHPVSLNRLHAQGSMQRSDESVLQLRAGRLDVVSDYVDASLQGDWRQGGSDAGIVDVTGAIHRADIEQIDEHLPNGVDFEARAWMAKGLVAGEIEDATLLLKGDLAHFPFGTQAEQGDFRITGKYSGGIIDYVPTTGKTLGWPRLVDMKGMVDLHRTELRLSANQATMWTTPALSVQVNDVKAHIPDLEHSSVLSIQGETTAKAAAYLALMKHSPLGAMLNGVFDQATAEGVWAVPLSLKIPLVDPHRTTVDGAIHFSGNTLKLFPDMPLLKKVNGTLKFTDTQTDAVGLTAEFLGGPLTVKAGLGGTQKGLQLQGQLLARDLNDYVGIQGMKRLTGVIPYAAVLNLSKSGLLTFGLDSTLAGLALDLPAPLGKTAAQTMALHVTVQAQKDGKTTLSNVKLGEMVELRLLHQNKRKDGSYFQAAAVGVNQKPELPAQGMAFDLRYPQVDADAWNSVIEDFSTPQSSLAGKWERALLPDLSELRLQAQRLKVQGLVLDALTFTARQPGPAQWRVDISSTQTAGTLFWREANGRIAGKVDADFHRLSLGRDPSAPVVAEDSSAQDLKFNDELDIPAVNLHVKQLRLYGREVGELSLLGVNQSRGQLWQLDELKLDSPSATLTGSGTWRLTGAERGLTIHAQADVRDLGAYLDQVGYQGIMVGGHGMLKGDLEWRNMPWAFSKADLNGNVEVSMEKGRFSGLNSRSARLLELLSLQSVSRLARLDFNPQSLTKEGFPYDTLRGTFNLKAGLLSTHDYRVIGPAGTIVLDGRTNLLDEGLNLQAVVVPSLDVSGAAIAAGIAINPIVGIGAFLTQWLLRAPLSKAMAAQYHIGGTWDAPLVTEVTKPEKPAKATEPIPH